MSVRVASNVELARGALEQVCSGQCLDRKQAFYSPDFLDHVNGARLTGYAGIERSVAKYRRLLRQLTIVVKEHVAEGDKVVCRFVVSGVVMGKSVSCDGITISRIENGLIAEDWSVTDAMSLLRQIGFWRLAAWYLKAGWTRP